ncbi:MAG TPA: YfbM family protein [Phycisphaerales bacterium]|nr:YfbM family protein [Phycisphaerales bacterium]
MGMVCEMHAVSESTIEELIQDPSGLESLLAGMINEDDGELTDEGLSFDLDKSWHAIHFLLTGSTEEGEWPEAFMLVGGRPIGDEEYGYTIPRAFSAAEVRAIADALEAVPVEDFASRFDARKLSEADVYPGIWDEPEHDLEESREYVVTYYDQLRQFLGTIAHKGMSMVLLIT